MYSLTLLCAQFSATDLRIDEGSGRERRSASRRAVAVVLRLDRVTGLRPFGVAPFAQFVEIAAGGEPLRAVHGDRLAGQPAAAVAEQEGRQVLNFLQRAAAPHRVGRRRARARLLAGVEPLAHALGRDLAGRDGVEADA